MHRAHGVQQLLQAMPADGPAPAALLLRQLDLGQAEPARDHRMVHAPAQVREGRLVREVEQGGDRVVDPVVPVAPPQRVGRVDPRLTARATLQRVQFPRDQGRVGLAVARHHGHAPHHLQSRCPLPPCPRVVLPHQPAQTLQAVLRLVHHVHRGRELRPRPAPRLGPRHRVRTPPRVERPGVLRIGRDEHPYPDPRGPGRQGGLQQRRGIQHAGEPEGLDPRREFAGERHLAAVPVVVPQPQLLQLPKVQFLQLRQLLPARDLARGRLQFGPGPRRMPGRLRKTQALGGHPQFILQFQQILRERQGPGGRHRTGTILLEQGRVVRAVEAGIAQHGHPGEHHHLPPRHLLGLEQVGVLPLEASPGKEQARRGDLREQQRPRFPRQRLLHHPSGERRGHQHQLPPEIPNAVAPRDGGEELISDRLRERPRPTQEDAFRSAHRAQAPPADAVDRSSDQESGLGVEAGIRSGELTRRAPYHGVSDIRGLRRRIFGVFATEEPTGHDPRLPRSGHTPGRARQRRTMVRGEASPLHKTSAGRAPAATQKKAQNAQAGAKPNKPKTAQPSARCRRGILPR